MLHIAETPETVTHPAETVTSARNRLCHDQGLRGDADGQEGPGQLVEIGGGTEARFIHRLFGLYA
jgi:hypothetical protein